MSSSRSARLVRQGEACDHRVPPRYRAVTVALAATFLLFPTGAGTVQARDDAGVYEFIATQAPKRSQGGSPFSAFRPFEFPIRAPSVVPRALGRGPVAPTKYVNLPKDPDRVKPALPSLQKAVEVRDPVRMTAAQQRARLLNDPTLRRGDIVIFPEGPRVFTGASYAPHALHDFADLRGSRMVSEATRKQVLAMARPDGPRTALLRAPGKDIGAPVATPEPGERIGVRVVYSPTATSR
jgi:hypothetical protein